MFNHIFKKADKQKKLKPGVNKKLNKMAENVVYSYIHCFCEKNGIQEYYVLSTNVDEVVIAYIGIGQNKKLSIIYENLDSCKEIQSYLPILYDCAKKIINSSVKVQSGFFNTWSYPKLQRKIKDDTAVQEYHTEIQKRLHSQGFDCQIIGYKDYCRIKITRPMKLSSLNARVSYSNFSYDLSALEEFLKIILEFANVPVHAFII